MIGQQIDFTSLPICEICLSKDNVTMRRLSYTNYSVEPKLCLKCWKILDLIKCNVHFVKHAFRLLGPNSPCNRKEFYRRKMDNDSSRVPIEAVLHVNF